MYTLILLLEIIVVRSRNRVEINFLALVIKSDRREALTRKAQFPALIRKTLFTKQYPLSYVLFKAYRSRSYILYLKENDLLIAMPSKDEGSYAVNIWHSQPSKRYISIKCTRLDYVP